MSDRLHEKSRRMSAYSKVNALAAGIKIYLAMHYEME